MLSTFLPPPAFQASKIRIAALLNAIYFQLLQFEMPQSEDCCVHKMIFSASEKCQKAF